MRESFIIQFLQKIKETAVDMGRAWARVPYKGFRYSDFSIGGYDNRKKYVGFKNLERRGLIRPAKQDNFYFTRDGKRWLQSSFLRYFKSKNGKWDKKWRVIVFDIPKELHLERIKFRRKIMAMGFLMLQKSVFVFPYPCGEEVGDIARNLGIGSYVDIITAESVGFREEEFLKEFGL